ncbi:MAG: Ku protein, partial [Candidatus Eremiobacteraeota bacterium]|nr:Ku protein [Candidatus Eremiobacteraeota bacterium]
IMHWADEIVEADTLDFPKEEKMPPAEMKMAKMLIDTMAVEKFEPENFKNKYHEELMAMIEARAAGKELPKAKKSAPRATVVNLMDVLQQSLDETKKHRATREAAPAKKATAAKKKRVA